MHSFTCCDRKTDIDNQAKAILYSKTK